MDYIITDILIGFTNLILYNDGTIMIRRLVLLLLVFLLLNGIIIQEMLDYIQVVVNVLGKLISMYLVILMILFTKGV